MDQWPGKAPKLYYYLTDQVNSVLQIVDANGNVVEQRAYDAFGNERSKYRLEAPGDGLRNRYWYHGREWDDVATQYHYRYRQYDPFLGSFTNPDFLKELRRFGIADRVFCANNPLMYIDPMGLTYQMCTPGRSLPLSAPLMGRWWRT